MAEGEREKEIEEGFSEEFLPNYLAKSNDSLTVVAEYLILHKVQFLSFLETSDTGCLSFLLFSLFLVLIFTSSTGSSESSFFAFLNSLPSYSPPSLASPPHMVHTRTVTSPSLAVTPLSSPTASVSPLSQMNSLNRSISSPDEKQTNSPTPPRQGRRKREVDLIGISLTFSL